VSAPSPKLPADIAAPDKLSQAAAPVAVASNQAASVSRKAE